MRETGFSLLYDGRELRFSGAGRHVIDDTLTVTAVRREYPDFDAAQWVLWWENTGETDSGILSEIRDCDIVLPLRNVRPKDRGNRVEVGFPCVTAMTGMAERNGYGHSAYHYDDRVSASEYNLRDIYLEDGRGMSFRNGNGRSSDTTVPFFDVHTKDSGAIVAVGWSCNWQAEFSRSGDGIRIRSGLQNARFYLKKGEKLRTTSVLIMEYENGDKHNKFRALMRQHFSHRANQPQRRDAILAFELWGSLPSHEMIRRIRQLREYDIPLEDIWIDAGWYGDGEVGSAVYDGKWQNHIGNWQVNPWVHPQGLRDVRDAAREAGCRLMLWMEPERACRGTPNTLAHPEWYLDIGTPYLLLNYGSREALENIFQTLCGHIEDLELSCYRQDFNMDPTPYFAQNDEPDRVGILEIRHITGMYELWDRLLEKYPALNIDNCASGGRRFDIETLRRANLFFRSDYQCLFNENPLVLQNHNTGAECYFPYNGCTSKTKGDTYAIRSSYAFNWGTACYNAVFQTMEAADFLWLKKTVEELKSIRKYFGGDFYNHGSAEFDESSWTVWQYHDPESQSGIVMAFRRCASPFARAEISLKGLAPGGTCAFRNLDDQSTFAGGPDLEIMLPEKRSSTIIEYRLLPQTE